MEYLVVTGFSLYILSLFTVPKAPVVEVKTPEAQVCNITQDELDRINKTGFEITPEEFCEL